MSPVAFRSNGARAVKVATTVRWETRDFARARCASGCDARDGV